MMISVKKAIMILKRYIIRTQVSQMVVIRTGEKKILIITGNHVDYRHGRQQLT